MCFWEMQIYHSCGAVELVVVVVVVVSPLSTFLNNPTSKFLWFWFLGLVGRACEAVWNDNVWWSVRFFRAMDGAIF